MHLESPSPSLHPSTTRSSSSCFVQTLACVSVSAPQAADSSHARLQEGFQRSGELDSTCLRGGECMQCSQELFTHTKAYGKCKSRDRQTPICEKTRRMQKHAQLFWNMRKFYFEITVGFIHFLALSGQPGHLAYCNVQFKRAQKKAKRKK